MVRGECQDGGGGRKEGRLRREQGRNESEMGEGWTWGSGEARVWKMFVLEFGGGEGEKRVRSRGWCKRDRGKGKVAHERRGRPMSGRVVEKGGRGGVLMLNEGIETQGRKGGICGWLNERIEKGDVVRVLADKQKGGVGWWKKGVVVGRVEDAYYGKWRVGGGGEEREVIKGRVLVGAGESGKKQQQETLYGRESRRGPRRV